MGAILQFGGKGQFLNFLKFFIVLKTPILQQGRLGALLTYNLLIHNMALFLIYNLTLNSVIFKINLWRLLLNCLSV
jgi:hypothetical protein